MSRAKWFYAFVQHQQNHFNWVRFDLRHVTRSKSKNIRACGAVGSASASHAEGHRFNSGLVHFFCNISLQRCEEHFSRHLPLDCYPSNNHAAPSWLQWIGTIEVYLDLWILIYKLKEGESLANHILARDVVHIVWDSQPEMRPEKECWNTSAPKHSAGHSLCVQQEKRSSR